MKFTYYWSKLFLVFLLYAIVGTLGIYLWYNPRWNSSIFELTFGYGKLLKNIILNGTYTSQEHPALTIEFTSHRLPSIPYFIVLLTKLLGVQTIGWVALVKNIFTAFLLSSAFYFATIDKKIKNSYKILGLLFVLTFPQLAVQGLSLDIEEGYVIPVLALFWSLVVYSGKQTKFIKILFVILIGALFFVKNTFLYISPVLVLIQYLLFKNKKVALASLLVLFLSATFSAYFNYQQSGKFTYKYSLEGWNIYNGNCARTMDVYPEYSIDILDYENPLLPPPGTVHNEWELDAFFKEKAYEYVRNNPEETIRRLFVKAFTVLIDIRPNGIHKEHKRWESPLKIVGAVYMLFFRIMMWLCIAWALIDIFGSSKQNRLFAYGFLIFIGMFFAPYILAFGFERHIIPLVLPILFTFIYYIDKKFITKS